MTSWVSAVRCDQFGVTSFFLLVLVVVALVLVVVVRTVLTEKYDSLHRLLQQFETDGNELAFLRGVANLGLPA